MGKWRLVLGFVLALALIIVSLRPARADTSDLAKVALITGAVAAGIVLIAIVGTALTRDEPEFLSIAARGPDDQSKRREDSIRFGSSCPGGAGALVACW